MNNFKLNNWINNQRRKTFMKVERVNLKNINNWIFNESVIYHKKRKFFSILPYKFKTNFGEKKNWDQPLILQNEIGIVGIIKKKGITGDQYLLQAKIEPGNINAIQLAPTVQATKSNYLRVHGGKDTKYLNFFRKKGQNYKIISKLQLSEQGTRYFGKLNNHILLELKSGELKLHSKFIWVTKENLNYLTKKKNILNMDTISVFSCSIKQNPIDFPKNSFSKIRNKIKNFKKKYYIKKIKSSFKDLNSWKIKDKKIFDIKKNFFSVIGIDVKTNAREIKKWGQPLINDHSISFNGFLLKKFNQTNHYLLQLVLEPGFESPKFTSTVAIKNLDKKKDKTNSVKYFEFFIKKRNIMLDIINSDEGGRFYRNEARNIVVLLNKNRTLRLFNNYIWASHNQVVEMINKNLLAIEARNLFACFNIDKIK